jgi:hypothetical protein
MKQATWLGSVLGMYQVSCSHTKSNFGISVDELTFETVWMCMQSSTKLFLQTWLWYGGYGTYNPIVFLCICKTMDPNKLFSHLPSPSTATALGSHLVSFGYKTSQCNY